MRSKILLLLSLALLMICFCACQEDPGVTPLDTPQNIRFEGNTLCWDAVPNASGYMIYHKDQEYEVTETEFDVFDLITTDDETFSFIVQALSDDLTQHNNSQKAKKINYPYMYFDGWEYTKIEGEEAYEISVNYEKRDQLVSKIAMPNTYQGLPITKMRDHIFSQNKHITSVFVSNHIVEIPEHAFRQCSNLKEVHLPNGLILIDTAAFYGSGLQKIQLPLTVTTVGLAVFEECAALEEVILNEGLQKIDESAFLSCPQLKALHIPSTVQEMTAGMVGDCGKLTTLTVAEENALFFSKNNCIMKKSAPEVLFFGCAGSTIPAEITTIGAYAFSGCRYFTSIDIPEGITVIEETAFFGCRNAEKINLPSTLKSIGKRAFMHCEKVASIVIPQGVENIEILAFDSKNRNVVFILPASAAVNAKDAFGEATVYTDAIINENRMIGGQCVTGCTFAYENGKPYVVSIPLQFDSNGSCTSLRFDGYGADEVLIPVREGYTLTGWTTATGNPPDPFTIRTKKVKIGSTYNEPNMPEYFFEWEADYFITKEELQNWEDKTDRVYYAVWVKNE